MSSRPPTAPAAPTHAAANASTAPRPARGARAKPTDIPLRILSALTRVDELRARISAAPVPDGAPSCLVPGDDTDLALARFLASRRNRVDRAEVAYLRYSRWWHLNRQLPTEGEREAFYGRTGTLAWGGVDRQGRPTLIVRLGNMPAKWPKHLRHVAERVAVWTGEEMVRRMGEGVLQAVVIVDWAGWQVREVNRTLAKNLVRIMSRSQPERLHAVYFVNTPGMMWLAAWSMIKLDGHTKDKFRVLKTSSQLTEFFERSQLPPHYGGKSTTIKVQSLRQRAKSEGDILRLMNNGASTDGGGSAISTGSSRKLTGSGSATMLNNRGATYEGSSGSGSGDSDDDSDDSDGSGSNYDGDDSGSSGGGGAGSKKSFGRRKGRARGQPTKSVSFGNLDTAAQENSGESGLPQRRDDEMRASNSDADDLLKTQGAGDGLKRADSEVNIDAEDDEALLSASITVLDIMRRQSESQWALREKLSPAEWQAMAEKQEADRQKAVLARRGFAESKAAGGDGRPAKFSLSAASFVSEDSGTDSDVVESMGTRIEQRLRLAKGLAARSGSGQAGSPAPNDGGESGGDSDVDPGSNGSSLSSLGSWGDRLKQLTDESNTLVAEKLDMFSELQRRFRTGELSLPDWVRNRTEKFAWEIDVRELEIDRLVSRGGMGAVYHGKWRGTDVAIKTIRESVLSNHELEVFLEEVQMLSQVRHPNVVHFVGCSYEPPFICALTEWHPMGSLHSMLKSGELQWPTRLRMAVDAAKGILCLHGSGIVHSDIKPLNLLVAEGYRCVVADLGLSRLQESTTALGAKLGTLNYTPPEIMEGESHTIKGDVYSFGMVLFQVLTSAVPFHGKNELQIIHSINEGHMPELPESCPAEYAALVRRCWERDPANRPSMTEVLATLEGMVGESTKHAMPSRYLANSVEASPHVMVVTDNDGVIVLFNRRAGEAFAVPESERAAMQGRHFSELMNEPVRRSGFWMAEYATGEEASRHGAEERFVARRRDGTSFLAHTRPTHILENRRVFVMHSIDDITALARAETLNAAIVENALEGHVVIDSKGLITQANQASCRLLGYLSPTELVGQRYVQCIVPRRFRQHHRGVLERIAHAPVRDGEGVFIGRIIGVDVTTQDRTERQVLMRIRYVALPGSDFCYIAMFRPPKEKIEPEALYWKGKGTWGSGGARDGQRSSGSKSGKSSSKGGGGGGGSGMCPVPHHVRAQLASAVESPKEPPNGSDVAAGSPVALMERDTSSPVETPVPAHRPSGESAAVAVASAEIGFESDAGLTASGPLTAELGTGGEMHAGALPTEEWHRAHERVLALSTQWARLDAELAGARRRLDDLTQRRTNRQPPSGALGESELHALGLGRHARLLLALGFDTRQALASLRSEDLDPLVADGRLLPGHRRAILSAVAELQER